MHGDMRDLVRQVDVSIDDVRQLLDRRTEIVLAAGAEDVVQRHGEGLGRVIR